MREKIRCTATYYNHLSQPISQNEYYTITSREPPSNTSQLNHLLMHGSFDTIHLCITHAFCKTNQVITSSEVTIHLSQCISQRLPLLTSISPGPLPNVWMGTSPKQFPSQLARLINIDCNIITWLLTKRTGDTFARLWMMYFSACFNIGPLVMNVLL